MAKRNTKKEKLKNNKGFPYKHRRKCLECGRTYGHDRDADNGLCPACTPNMRRLTKRYEKLSC